ncbi:MAG TPA: diaminopimelate decarboxylase [Solirubrobacteraceae bacterium]|nr:diaminopimelate decarboxylase [Solirubrobacteraceae bacterium]
MATHTGSLPAAALSGAFPVHSAVNARGRLEIGGCDAIELAREFATPAYVVAEEDLRERARAFLAAARACGHPDLQVVFASKAFPCTAVLQLFADEGLWCDVASAGELHLALNAGFPAEHIVLHGNAKSIQELRMALEAGVGLIVIDNFDEIDRLRGLLDARPDAEAGGGSEAGDGSGAGDGLEAGDDAVRPAHEPAGGAAHVRPREAPHAAPPSTERAPQAVLTSTKKDQQAVLIRVTPDVRGDTHDHISTGQADSKFGFSMADAPAAIARVSAVEGLRLEGLHAHVGSQLLDLEPFRREAAELAKLGDFPVWDVGGGLGVRYTADQPEPPSVEAYVEAVAAAASEHGMGERGRRLLIEPGRSLTANSCVTVYTVESVKQNVSRWVAVDGGMSDNLRPMLYSAAYEAHVADRLGGETECVLAGKHCESGDVIVRRALLDDPRPGDVIVTPATGAYGHAMASNYNGVPRPPVIFCAGGHARVVLRRETLDDLLQRDIDGR